MYIAYEGGITVQEHQISDCTNFTTKFRLLALPK